ncbi:MAG: hypothetical protein EAZ87_04410 [Nostocales cyanobacterium]|nr:MAG: hypothetical protein EAZ87_04410 [Nostocales cyanobacterium]
MKVAFQQEDIQLLSSILQEQLRIEIPAVPVLEVKCALKNEQLMILTQHPPGVSVDTDKIFAVLEESLQWQSQYHNEKIQLYVRVSGDKLPYEKKLITVQAKEVPAFPELQIPDISDDNEIDDNGNGHNGNGHSKEVIFPPLDIPEMANPITEDIITNNPFSYLMDDETNDQTPAPTFGSLTEENNSKTILSNNSDLNSETILTDRDVSDHHNFLQAETDISNDVHDSFRSDVTFSSDNSLLEDRKQNHDFGSPVSLIDDQDHDGEIEYPSPDEQVYDPFENAEELTNRKKPPLQLPPIPVIIGIILVITGVFGGGAFFMTRSCIIGSCQELQTAEQLKTKSQTLLSQATSETELIPLQQQIDQAISGLKTIPQFSPRYQEAQQLTNNFSQQSTKINSVIQGLQTGSQAEQSSQKPPTSIDDLRNRQNLWRKAIAPLESVKSSPEFSQIVKAKLPTYQNQLKSVNKQLLTEEGWQKKLATAKTIANAALKRQAEAKSATDWQRVQSGWRQAVNTLRSIPQNSAAYTEAENLLKNYGQQLDLVSATATRETRAVQNYQQAVSFASQAKSYENSNNWQAAVSAWDQAVSTAQQVSSDSTQYTQAQALIAEYTQSAAQAKEKFQLYGNLDQTRADLNSTCVNGIRFCNFNIENGRIIVRLTPDYDQRLLSGSPNLQNHFSTLQQALGVISENSNLPVVLFNSQGQERYMKNPQ